MPTQGNAWDLLGVLTSSMKSDVWALSLIVFSTLLVGILLTLFIHAFELQTYVQDILIRIKGLGAWAPFIFIMLDILVVIFLLPGLPLTLGAGFLFGVVAGSVYVVIATSLGAILAFLIARHGFSSRAIAKLDGYPRLKLVDRALSQEGWKIVFLTRLIPFFPFKLSNYLFGLTEYELRDFAVGTFFGIWPFTILNVYVGSIVADISLLGTSMVRTNTQWILYFMGFAVAACAVIYIGHRARLALKSLTTVT